MNRYIEAIGRRKTAAARVRLTEADKNNFTVNDKPLEEYFTISKHQEMVMAPLKIWGNATKFTVSVKVSGGGVASQAEAIRHGVARILAKFDPETRLILKQAGYLKRDPRKKERKKPGLRKARKAPQWSKR